LGEKSVLWSEVFISVSKLPSLPGYYFFTFVDIIKPTDFKGPDPYYYSNSVVELRENEKDVAAPLNLWLGTADTKQKAFTVAI